MESPLGAAAKYAAGTLVPGSHPYIQSLLHRPHCFTRKIGRPCIRQPTPVEDTTDQTPQPPNRQTTCSHYLSSTIFIWYVAAGEAHTQRYEVT